jgi:hypothetical protein
MVFHGGRSLFGLSYVESSPASFMYRNYPDRQALYGKGFTLYGRLDPPRVQVSQREVLEKISDRYFDLIVYGSVCRNKQYWELVERVYPKNRIVFIDGEDHTLARSDCVGRGHYFKRELMTHGVVGIYPLSFGIPKELIVRNTVKVKEYAHIDPADPSTYIYSDEQSYYQDYQQSYFGHTQKKGGWDCLRHYEILMNNCFPALREIEAIPCGTMVGFPKSIIREYFLKYGYKVSAEYDETMRLMLAALERSCTTEALWHRILEVI